MYRRWQLWLGIPVLALAALLLTTSPAGAQRWGRGGGNAWHNGNGWNGYYGNGYYGNGYYGNGYYGNGYYGNGYYPGFYGLGLGRGFYGNNGYGRGYYGNGYYGNSNGYYYPSNDYADYSQTPNSGYSSFYPSEDMPQNAAMVHVRVPANAELWFGGDKTSQTGPMRDFVTPELKQDKDYFYTLKARWMEDGKAVERTKRVKVRPGANVMVDFQRPDTTADTPERRDNREERREVQPAPDRVKPPADRTPAKPIPNTPRNEEAVP